MPRFLLSFFVFPLIFLTAAQQPASTKNYTLVWHDEFDGPNGSLPDPAKWTYDLGGGGWGNQELESYTNRAENARIENGNLVITARKENYEGSDQVTREYTSARLKTQGHFSQAYGRFEARIKIPAGQGMWPAFWMLGDNITSAGWPKCGEIDIMENIGREPGTIHGSLHGPLTTGSASDLTAGANLTSGKEFAADFHLYAVEWDPGTVRFYVDSTLYATFTPDSAGASSAGSDSAAARAGSWVFDHPFYLILNVAVGGGWPGVPDATTTFPQTMLVDYVRVYSAKR
ncbi:MAG: glycoside hydrolase family 16 protein [Candidatus Acidiferrum sp.]